MSSITERRHFCCLDLHFFWLFVPPLLIMLVQMGSGRKSPGASPCSFIFLVCRQRKLVAHFICLSAVFCVWKSIPWLVYDTMMMTMIIEIMIVMIMTALLLIWFLVISCMLGTRRWHVGRRRRQNWQLQGAAMTFSSLAQSSSRPNGRFSNSRLPVQLILLLVPVIIGHLASCSSDSLSGSPMRAIAGNSNSSISSSRNNTSNNNNNNNENKGRVERRHRQQQHDDGDLSLWIDQQQVKMFSGQYGGATGVRWSSWTVLSFP